MPETAIVNRFYPRLVDLIIVDDLPEFSSLADNMNIVYLTQLNNNPSYTEKTTGYIDTLQPISLDEINSLEAAFNSGNQFPAVLRELLYIAGAYCFVLDYGYTDTQEEVQAYARKLLTDNNRQITRPFFAIDLYGGDQFLFVYLDEGTDDPMVYAATQFSDPDNTGWVLYTGGTLSSLINDGLVRLLSGHNPF